MKSEISGVYGILPADLATEYLLSQAESALKAGIRTLQLRDKKQGYKRALKRACALRALTQQYDATFVVNDSIQLAKEAQADGVHLGRDDIHNIVGIRDDVGAAMHIGVTCRADAVFAKLALRQGADSVSFGAVFASQTKSDVPVLGIPRLQKARQMFPDANICAIGGITLKNIAMVKQAGATSVAVISSLFDADDIEQRAREMIAAWEVA